VQWPNWSSDNPTGPVTPVQATNKEICITK
jgi:hypothetical protein